MIILDTNVLFALMPLAANSVWRDVANQNSLYINTLDCRPPHIVRG